MFKLTKDFHFEAAHWLPFVGDGHKCRRMHGHSYIVRVEVAGPISDDGMVIDYADVSSVAGSIIAALDHRVLNEIIENPTAERLASWLFGKISAGLPLLSAVSVSETKDTWAEYRP